jgi:hypothetical protein
MPCTFWFYLITHVAWMMNAIPGKHSGCLASPFLLVHGEGHNEQTWVPLFLLAYFHHKKMAMSSFPSIRHIQWTASSSADPLHLMHSWCIIHVTSSTMSRTDCLDPYRLPGLAYPSIKYDGGFFCSLLHIDNPQFEEKYPPGTQV